MSIARMHCGSFRVGLAATLSLLVSACSGSTETTGGTRDGAVTANSAHDANPDDSTDASVTDAPPTMDAGPRDAPGGEAASDGGMQCGLTAGRVPIHHHAAGTTCSQQRPPWTPTANCTPDAGGTCAYDSCFQDSDCTMGANGRCGAPGGPAILGCSYDECFQDTDCDGGGACLCRPPGSSGPPSVPNVCAPAGNCTVDSDCGQGGYCSPSNAGPYACECVSRAPCDGPDGSGVTDAYPPGPTPGVGCFESSDGGPWVQVACECSNPYPCGHGYYCHTGCDQCLDDADCGGGDTCAYSLTDQRWECIAQDCPL
jgi:hypothetical protein